MVELAVADNERGISPANAERIFTPFFNTARESGGSGLGFCFARSLVSAHGGEITLASAERGAIFIARPPVR